MELNNDIEVNAPIGEVWAAFNDVERIAPCLPGAQLQEIEGEEYRGIVKVKVGPITAQYKGKATFIEQNEADRRVVIKGDGRDTRGAGNASALITATLDQVSDTVTKVNVHTDLTITGKVAQFGRGAIADVSTKLMGQFADNLEELLDGPTPQAPVDAEPALASKAASDAVPGSEASTAVTADAPASASAAAPAAASTIRKVNSPEPEAVDLLEMAGTPVLKRVAPVVALILLLLLIRRLIGGRD